MTNHISSYPILCASFNQDNSYFAVGTKVGFKIFHAHTGMLCYEREIGAFNIVEMCFSSSLLAFVGAGEQPALSPRRLCLFNKTTEASVELNFLTSVIAVRLNKIRLIVVLQDNTFIYDIASLTLLSTVDTVPNLKGLCAFSHSLNACFLALPASTAKGTVLVYNVNDLNSHCEIDAHRSPLAAMVFSSEGTYLATASEQGTMIRVYMVSVGTKVVSFRRGAYPSTIFSLSFGPSMELPDVLATTSSSGSLHVFMLGSAVSQRAKKSGSVIGSLIPGPISDALDPAHHHVLHNAVAEGVKSYAVIRKVEKFADGSTSKACYLRASISVIGYHGYLRDYILSINHRNESSWTLEREYNLLNAISAVATG